MDTNANEEERLPKSILELRKKQRGLLKINDVFGPAITVKNEVFREFLDICAEQKIPDDNFFNWIDKWIEKAMTKRGFIKIPDNRTFSRVGEKEWAKEYKTLL